MRTITELLGQATPYALSALAYMSRPGAFVYEALNPSTLGDSSLSSTYTNDLAKFKFSYASVLKSTDDVTSSLKALGLESKSLERLRKHFALHSRANGYSLIPFINVIGVNKTTSWITLNPQDVADSTRNLNEFLSSEYSDRIIKMNGIIDQLLAFAFIEIAYVGVINSRSMGERAHQMKNISFVRSVSQLPQGGHSVSNVASKGKSMNINVSSTLVPFSEWNEWKIDYDKLRVLFATVKDKVADVNRMQELAYLLAPAVGAPPKAVELVLHLECSYPNVSTYRSTMPRNDGSRLYVGVTQMSRGFWTDVSKQLVANKVTNITSRDETTLMMQIAAPFLYAQKYKTYRSEKDTGGRALIDYPVTPSLIYAFHQQSFNGLKYNFQKIDGNQSGLSVQVVKAAGTTYKRRSYGTF